MKTLRLLLLCVVSEGVASAAPPRLLLQPPTLSPDAIAFDFAGEIWTVPRAGGSARRLVAGQGRPLFNGRDLSGWEHVGKGRVFVEGGLLKTEGGMGLLWYTKEKFGNCTLRVVYRTTTLDDNSGVFIRIPEPPKDPWQAVHTGYEVQILENFPAHYKRSEHQLAHGDDWHTTGAIYSISRATARPQRPAGEWNTLEIALDGPRTMVRLNGQVVNDFTEGQPVPPRQHDYEPIRGPRPDFGYVGIQNHHEPQTVHFKEISVWEGRP